MKKWQHNEQYGTGQYLLSRLQTWWRNRKVHSQIKDRLFRFLFEKDREALLQLYNALNGTDYKDASELEVVTIESAVYIVMKNDLAMHCLLQWREKYA